MSNALPWGKGLLSASRDDLTPQGASIPSNNSPSLRKGAESSRPVGVCAHSGAGGCLVSNQQGNPVVSGQQDGQHPAGRHREPVCVLAAWAVAAAGCCRDTQGKETLRLADLQSQTRTVVKDT